MAEGVEQDVRERLAFIESMMREGRRGTEYWGWSFVLWGVAYLVALGWSYRAGSGSVAWPVTMVGAGLITAAIAARKQRGKPNTTLARAIGASWVAVGCALFLFCFSAAFTGHLEVHSFLGAVESFLGIANFISGTVLRWRVQQWIAGMWWAAAATTFWVNADAILWLFIAALLIGQIGFGVYLMVREFRDRARARAGQVIHA